MLFGQLPDALAGDFLASGIGFVLDNAGKFNLGTARQANMVIGFKKIG